MRIDREETPIAAEPARCNGSALRKANRRVSQLYDTVLAPSGLRSTQRSILVQIAGAGRSPSIGELADALVLDRSALTHNLKPLERDGLVEINVDTSDQRSQRVALTERGRAKLEESRELWRVAQDRFEAAFGTEPAKLLRDALAKIAPPDFWEVLEGQEGCASPPAR